MRSIAFYHSTVDRKWGSAYLTRAFFSLLGERLGDRVVLMMAENDGKPVAGALNLAGDEALYGRNWGCRGDWPFLHFELCYYRAIDWAIEHGLQRVEAGAQGRHKIQRGYLPKPTYSAHWIAHAGLRRAVANFVEEERAGHQARDGGAGGGFAVPQGWRGGGMIQWLFICDRHDGVGQPQEPSCRTRPLTRHPHPLIWMSALAGWSVRWET